jgi:hypothetical protein
MLWHVSYFESASKDNKQVHNKLCEKTRKIWTSPRTTQIKKTKKTTMNTTRKRENQTKKRIVFKPTSAKKFALNSMRNRAGIKVLQ